MSTQHYERTIEASPARVILLHRTYPCCAGKSRFVAEAEVYERRCRNCGQAWTVRRTTLAETDFARRLAARFDSLAWDRVS